MQRFNSASRIGNYLRGSISIISGHRNHTSLSNASPIIHDAEEVVLFEERPYSRTAVFNRPSVLNCLSTPVASRLCKLYKSWENNPDVGFVVLKGRGRSYSAGGDLVTLYRFMKDGNMDAVKDFFQNVCNFVYLLGTYSKPHVALLNGITMGGGGGFSVPGTFRVATDKTVFAVPETLIGYHVDAGASYYLSRLPGHLGEYLGLTGDRLTGDEMIGCGLATHYSLAEKLPLIEEELGKLVTDDPSVITTSLNKYYDLVSPRTTSVVHRLETVNKCFSHDTVEEIVDALENEAAKTTEEWCISALKNLKYASPLSLKVCLRSIREARSQTLEQCLVREYRMTLQACSRKISNDFSEGIRARMIDKDGLPKWDPPSLGYVSSDMVDEYFSRLSESEPDVELPTREQRKASA